MGKIILILVSLFLCLTLEAQVIKKDCRQSQYWEPAHIENYVGGIMILSAFPLVEHVNSVLYNKHVNNQPFPDYDKWVNQRTTFAISYMVTSLGTTYLIRKIRLRNEKNHRRY